MIDNYAMLARLGTQPHSNLTAFLYTARDNIVERGANVTLNTVLKKFPAAMRIAMETLHLQRAAIETLNDIVHAKTMASTNY